MNPKFGDTSLADLYRFYDRKLGQIKSIERYIGILQNDLVNEKIELSEINKEILDRS